MMTFEERLASNLEWALMEGSIFFENRGAVQTALRRITKRLEEIGVPYAVAGGMALFAHGVRRFTEDVDILVTADSLKRIHEELEGRGYRPPHSNSKNLRDTQESVRIEFLVAGQFPGDGKPKPIAFPEPSKVAVEIDGIRYVNLETLISLKIASGLTGQGRAKDIGDVQELISSLKLPLELTERLDPYARDEYQRIWRSMHQQAKKYVLLWRNKSLTADAKSINDMVERTSDASETLRAMLADGVMLDPSSRIADDYALLVTNDAEVATKYGMTPEDEFWLPGKADGTSSANE